MFDFLNNRADFQAFVVRYIIYFNITVTLGNGLDFGNAGCAQSLSLRSYFALQLITAWVSLRCLWDAFYYISMYFVLNCDDWLCLKHPPFLWQWVWYISPLPVTVGVIYIPLPVTAGVIYIPLLVTVGLVSICRLVTVGVIHPPFFWQWVWIYPLFLWQWVWIYPPFLWQGCGGILPSCDSGGDICPSFLWQWMW